MKLDSHHSQDGGQASVISQKIEPTVRDVHRYSAWPKIPRQQAVCVQVQTVRAKRVIAICVHQPIPILGAHVGRISAFQRFKHFALQIAVQFHRKSPPVVDEGRVRASDSTTRGDTRRGAAMSDALNTSLMQRRCLIIRLAQAVFVFQAELPEHFCQNSVRRTAQRLLSNVARQRQQLRHRFHIRVHAGSLPGLCLGVHSYFPSLIFIDGAHCAGARSIRHA